MTNANKLVSTLYTEESWAEFTKVLDETYSFILKGEFTQSTVDAAEQKLQAAIDALVLKDNFETSNTETNPTESSSGCTSAITSISAVGTILLLSLGIVLKKKEN